ncbi:MAG: S8 family serine peptidase [Chlorobi bacterium]|nr:S8 family serine peptidase [Chlorobiota bacterium]
MNEKTKRIVVLAGIVIVTSLVVLMNPFQLESQYPAPGEQYIDHNSIRVIPNVLVVKLKPGYRSGVTATRMNIASVDAVLEDIDAYRIVPLLSRKTLTKRTLQAAESEVARIFKVYYAAGKNPRELARLIENDPAVEYAEPDYIFPLNHTPNDPRLLQQDFVKLLKMTEAWDVTTGDSTIIIGDVDTGIDYNHEDLRNVIWINPGEWGTSGELSNNGKDDDGNGKVDDYRGWDFVGNGSAQAPRPDNNPYDNIIGHGTGTAGCAAAETNNGKGIASPAYKARILPVKVAPDRSAGIASALEGITYAAEMGCKVINCSFGGTGQPADFLRAYQDVINFAYSKGALVVASSGNKPIDNDLIPHYPSSLNHVLAVGSTEQNGAASSWSTYGTTIHVYTVGRRVMTTRKGGGYGRADGTSFSAPLTSGVAALVFSVHPDWTPDQVAKQIRVTADPFKNPPDPKRFARVNAFRAVSENQTLSDIPGIRLKNFIVSGPSGNMLTEPGQKAQVTVYLENVLAPTSAAATGTLEFENNDLTPSVTSFQIGEIKTMETKSFKFDVTLAQKPSTSEGNIPVRIKITDGSYIDYVMGRVKVYLAKAWHTTLGMNIQSFTSIDAVNDKVVWAVAHYVINNQRADLCVRTGNGGTNWAFSHGQGFPIGRGAYCVAGVNVNTAFVGTGPQDGEAGIYFTTNGGMKWEETPVANITGFVNWIHMWDAKNGIFQGDPKNGIWGIATTRDGGWTWYPISNSVSAAPGEAGWNNCYDQVANTMWFGTNSSKIYKSTDRGESWRAISTPGKNVVDISFANENVGVIRFGNVQNFGGQNGLAVTSDGGETWQAITTLTLPSSARALMERGGIRLWVLMNNDAYVSTDLGKSWSVDPSPSAFGPITTADMHVGSQTTTVFAAGKNIYKFVSPAQTTVAVDGKNEPSAVTLSQSWPNPASGAAAHNLTIEFSIREANDVNLSLYSIDGKLLRQLIQARLAAGHHATRLDTRSLKSGVYLYVLRAGNDRIVRKMVITR